MTTEQFSTIDETYSNMMEHLTVMMSQAIEHHTQKDVPVALKVFWDEYQLLKKKRLELIADYTTSLNESIDDDDY